MIKKYFVTLPFIALFLLSAFAHYTPAVAASVAQSSLSPLTITPAEIRNYKQVRACNHAVTKGFARCMAISLQPPVNKAQAFASIPRGLTPNALLNAYNLSSNNAGYGQTVAIIDAYDDPKAESDLAAYRKMFGLPPCTTANGCFTKVDQNGGTHYPSPDTGWAGEIALDLDMVSAISRNSHILLIESDDSSFENLGTAVNTAVQMGATIVSNSYGGQEDQQSAQSVAAYYNHPGTIITASSGDSGYGAQLPAAFNTLVAVGGTSLSNASNKRGWTETAWSGAGSGCSQYIAKPIWQRDSGCSNRSITDVSAVADPHTGVAVYGSYGAQGWGIYGGTSASAPIIAAVYALAGNANQIDGSYLYKHTANLNDVTRGNNGRCWMTYLCVAGTGYDGPTGLGTPNGTGAF